MKRLYITIIMVLMIVAFPQFEGSVSKEQVSLVEDNLLQKNISALSQAGEQGNQQASLMYMSRFLTSKSCSIFNNYSAPLHHNGTADFNEYLLSGWTLYNVTIDIENITAAPERKATNINNYNTFLAIYKNPGPPITYYDGIAQAFYNEPFNGSLLNYSLPYRTVVYDDNLYNNASLSIRSDPDSSIVFGEELNMSYRSTYDPWLEVDTSVVLNRSTNYWIVMDGEDLQEYDSDFPVIRWRGTNLEDTYTTEIRTRSSSFSEVAGYEIAFNYTYLPWNKTSSSALVFNDPTNISLQGNSTVLSGNTWSFSTISNNLTTIQFSSNQSSYIYYNLTLWYKKSSTATTNWSIHTSGDDVIWNESIALTYPSFTTLNSRFVNLTRMSDWNTTGLYNCTSKNNYINN